MAKWEYRHTFFVIILLVLTSCYILYKLPIKLGLDLKGGSHLVFQCLPTKEIKRITKNEVSQVVGVINTRLSASKEFEALVQPQGIDRIIVEIPEVKDLKRAIKIIGKTALLEFKDEKGKVILTGASLKKAKIDFDAMNKPEVDIEFNKEGARKFYLFTSRNVGKKLGIYLDGKIISDPVVNEPISGGKARISYSGPVRVQDVQDLANLLQGGALPVPLERVEERTVGPTLGKDSVDNGIKAGIVGFAIILIFMLIYYRLPGLIADIALSFYVIFVLAIFKLIPVTLTLPGIAGFILSIGMAVDANILIFERLREELRTNKTIRAALDAAFNRAFPSILDSNITTLISCGVLYYFGSGMIQGFALALSIGVLTSMFTAITVSRTILHLVLETEALNNPFLLGASPKTPFMIRKNFNLVGYMKYWFVISGLIILPGLIYLFPASSFKSFPPETGLKKGIDFKGGSLIAVKFKEKASVEKVRDIMAKFGRAKSLIQKAGKSEFFIRTEFFSGEEEKNSLLDVFKKENATVERFEEVGPIVGKELTRKAILSVFWASILIIFYLAFRFNQIRFGVCAVIALLHDVIVTTGIFAILGKYLNVEIDSLFITAILTIIGFSVNDTVVIYDRIRENLKLKKLQTTYEETVNFSLLQTFTRSINTVLTVIITIVVLLIFAGPVIRYFNIALLIGVTSGAYSSIFNASQLVALWQIILGRGKKAKVTTKVKPQPVFTTQIPSGDTLKTPVESQQQKKKTKHKKKRRR